MQISTSSQECSKYTRRIYPAPTWRNHRPEIGLLAILHNLWFLSYLLLGSFLSHERSQRGLKRYKHNMPPLKKHMLPHERASYTQKGSILNYYLPVTWTYLVSSIVLVAWYCSLPILRNIAYSSPLLSEQFIKHKVNKLEDRRKLSRIPLEWLGFQSSDKGSSLFLFWMKNLIISSSAKENWWIKKKPRWYQGLPWRQVLR